jgi:hypothetical protein
MKTETEIREALASESTGNLACLHNVLTIGSSCLQAGDKSHPARLLRVADELLAARGISVESGRLLARAKG